MITLKLSDILIAPNRQRREFDEKQLMLLADSIRANGLLHLPVVREHQGQYVLVAGERRLRAIQSLFDIDGRFFHEGQQYMEGFVAVTTLGELAPLAAEEAELEENVCRVDLTWQERADTIFRLRAMRDKQSAAAGTTPLTAAQFAEEVKSPKRDGFDGSSAAKVNEVTRELIVARNLSDPDVAKAKTLNDAFKVVRQKETTRQNEAMAQVIGKTFSGKDHTLVNGNAKDWMQDTILTNASAFDVILCDPPYGMNAQDFGDAGGKLITQDHTYDDSYENWRFIMDWFCPMSYVLAKPEAHIYVFCDIERFVELRTWLASAGWRMFRTPLIVHKTDGNRAPWPEHGPQRKYEMCAFGVKGDKRVNALRPDVIPCTGDENFGHGAQKPVALYRELLSRSVRPGNRVADFFCGTGPIFPAAHELKCMATGIELNPASYAIAAQRIQRLA